MHDIRVFIIAITFPPTIFQQFVYVIDDFIKRYLNFDLDKLDLSL